MKIKLVYVTSSLMRGGAEKIVYLIIKELQKRGIEQVVFYFHAGPYIQEIERLGIKVHQITGLFWRYDPVFFFRLYKALRDQKPDLVHSLLWAANVSARVCAWLQGIPIISVYHNNVDQDGLIRSLFDLITLRCAGRLIAVSDQIKESMETRGAVKLITVIPNGIEVQERYAHILKTKSDLGLSKDTFVIGAVGRFVEVKRLDYLIRVYASLPCDNVYLVIVGTGPLQNTLYALVNDLHLSSKVLFINDIALPYYNVFDCFVQPSYKEGVSLALLEAMSFAKPCIVVSDGYHPVITHGHDGIHVNSENQKELLEALSCLYYNRLCRRFLGQCALDTVNKRFSVAMMGARYHEVIMSMMC